ncbi:MAG: HU family DNA-binding protein [Lentisphaeria bacterium]|jgi:nucleoid DNA-binding protein
MTKRDLAIRIAHQTNLNQNDVMNVIQLTLDAIVNEVAAGRNVEFRKFGVFEVVVRKPRIGRNPNSPQDTVAIPERVVVKFKPGKIMEAKVARISANKLK